MGGVGKSQLVIEFAHAHAAEYEVVWWFTSDEPALLPDQFARLAVRLGVDPGRGDADAIREAVHNGLDGCAGWLLVFDNAETAGTVQAWIPTSGSGNGQPGHVLVTTRRDGFDALGKVLDLDVLSALDAVTLLRTRAASVDEDRLAAASLVEELGRLPLAVEQAAAYLNRTGLSVRSYVNLLRTRTADVITRGSVHGRGEVTIATLWDLSLERLSEHAPAAVQLLDVCAYLAPVAVPLNVFTAHPDRLPQPLRGVCSDELAFADIIAEISGYSLARRTPQGLQLHRLVQAAIRSHHNRRPASASGNVALSPTGDLMNAVLATTLGLLVDDAPNEVWGAPADWPRWAVLLPHVVAATAHFSGSAVGIDGHEVSPVDESAAWRLCAWLLDHAGAYMHTQGRYGDAVDHLRRAVSLTEAALGPYHPDLAPRLTSVATAIRDLGDPAAARPLAERAVAITEAATGPDDPALAGLLDALAAVIRDLGDPSAARAPAQRAVKITEVTLGPNHPALAARLHNLSVVVRLLGEPAAARPLAERAVAITENALGPDHPDLAAHLNTLAAVVRDLGDAVTARPLAERAVTITETVLGPDHPRLAARLSILAEVLVDLDDSAAARSLAERAVTITDAALGPAHPIFAARLNTLAAVLVDLGEPDAAQLLAERAVAITEASLGGDHLDLARRLGTFARALQAAGDPAAAKPLVERAIAITEASLGRTHPDLAMHLGILARVTRDLGDRGQHPA
jgi:tetratricopeptide (TPR) repeat protein